MQVGSVQGDFIRKYLVVNEWEDKNRSDLTLYRSNCSSLYLTPINSTWQPSLPVPEQWMAESLWVWQVLHALFLWGRWYTLHLHNLHMCDFTKYGISYVPDTKPSQDNVNRSFGPWYYDLVNKVISHEPKVADPWNFGEPYKMCKKNSKHQISSFKNVTYSAQNLLGRGSTRHVRTKD